MSFIQFFGSALQVTPHFHSLVPDGVFVPREGGVRFEPLPPPRQAEVERLPRVVRHRMLRLLEKRGALPAQGPEDALQTYQAHSLQQRLRWTEVDVRLPPRKQPRCAFLGCGGRRRVLAYVKGAGGERAIVEHLGLPTASAHLAAERGRPQSAWC